MTAAAKSRSAELLRRFFDRNVRIASAIEQRLAIETDRPLWDRFHQMVNDSLRALPAGAVFVDLGGGRRCEYAAMVPDDRPIRVIAADISAEELANNHDVEEKVVADVSKGLPFADGEVDLLVSRVLLEHVDGVKSAVEHIARVVKPGGRTIHFMPGRYSLFALAGRLLPFDSLLGLLHLARPDTVGAVEFEVHYDHTEPVAIERIFRAAGFRQVSVDWTPAQADYFKPLAPLYLLVVAYERIVRALGLSRLAGYLIVFAER